MATEYGSLVHRLAGKMIKIKLVRSPICTPEKHKMIVRSLGLGKLNQWSSGRIRRVSAAWSKKIPHLLSVSKNKRHMYRKP